MDVVVLGSGTPNPNPGRAGAAVAIVDGSSWVLVDCGRAATQRALSARLDLRTLEAVLITHHHSDHLSDLATLAITRWTAGSGAPLRVVAPAGPSAAFARRCLDPFDDQSFYGQASTDRPPPILIHEFDAGHDVGLVLEVAGWRAWSALVDHHPVEPAVGYAIERRGARVVVSGDTAVGDGMRRLADGAQVLVHEALHSARVSESLLEWNAGARSVGALAADTQPQTLLLTHLIPAPETAGEEQAFLDEVREGGFTGHTIVAHDLLRVRCETVDMAASDRVPEPADGDVRNVLLGWLAFHRNALEAKCAGLDADQLVERSAPPSPLSLLGLVRHLTEMERAYGAWALGPKTDLQWVWGEYTDDGPEWDIDADASMVEVSMAAWKQERAANDERIAAHATMDSIGAGNRHSLGWNLQKLIGEYARHNGHADLIRERIDGQTGE